MSSRSGVGALLAASCLVGGLFLGGHHPLAPALCVVVFCLWVLANARWPDLWVLVLPASLPWLNFSPWTGWLLFDESDLLVLGALAGAYGCRAWPVRPPPLADAPLAPAVQSPGPPDPWSRLLAAALVVSATLGLAMGLRWHDPWQFDWFADYTHPLNSLRVAKALVAGLLFWPLVRQTVHADPARAARSLVAGMVLGLSTVVIAALWERHAFPGLTDFTAVYRVTALFWEMHVGGAAIDAYLAMASPFALLFLLRAQGTGWRWMAVLLLAGLVYACLATFSRGVYLAVTVPLLGAALALGLARRRTRRGPAPSANGPPVSGRRTTWTVLAIAALLLPLAWLATGPDSFLLNRLTRTGNVWDLRIDHWQASLSLLRSPGEAALGIGSGRFPARYSEGVAGGAFAGSVQLEPAGTVGAGRALVNIRGPATDGPTGGLFALTQRVPIVGDRRYQISFDVRAPVAADVVVEVCERHLLYAWNCQGRRLQVAPGPGSAWRHFSGALEGDVFEPRSGLDRRPGMLSITVLNTGGHVQLTNIALDIGADRQLVHNGDFQAGLAHWFPAAQYYFVPWHPDSMYLDLLIERGWLGLVSGLGWLALAMVRAVRLGRTDFGMATCLTASLAALMLVGLVSSFLDVPRVALLMYLLCCFSIELGRPAAPRPAPTTQT